MLGAVIGLILLLVLLGVVWWGIQQLLPLIPIGEPFLTIIRVLLVILLAVIVIYVIIQLLGLAGIHVPTMGR
jgi:hypothetical protein